MLIEETKNIEKYLDPIKIKELGIAWNIADLIRKTKNPKRYLLEGQSLDDRNLRLDILNVIKGTGNIEKYLNPEIAKLLDLSEVQIIRLIKETKNIEKSISELPQNDIYNAIIDIINNHNYIKEVDETIIEIIENEMKKTKIKKEEVEGALKVIKIEEIYDKDKNYYILGLNQNIVPRLHEEDGIIKDKIKEEFGLFTSSDLNKLEKENLENILMHFPNIHGSYKIQDNFNTYYPSSIISDLNLEIEKEHNIKLNYSNKYNKLLLGSLLDDYINYNEKDSRIDILYPNYPKLEYKEYNNEYTGINSKKIKEYLNNKLTLSYSSMNNYFLCPFKFYIQNILKINKSEETFAILVGNLFHYVLQNLYTPTFDLDTYFAQFLKDKELSPKELFFINKLKETLKQDIKVIKMQDSYSKFNNKLTEKKISIQKKSKMEVNFVGIVDKISILDDYIIITDYKTGNIETTLDNINEGLNMQLPTYIYLIKKGYDNNKKIVGFYLQKLLNNMPLDGKENEINNSLKLNGYTINDEEIIDKIDNTYVDSEVIKGMKKTKNGFYSYTKLIKEKEIDLIEEIVEKNINKVINAVEKADFKINPKRLNNQLISCQYCKYKDLCYYREEDITILYPKTFKEIVGDNDAKLD